KNSNKMPLVTKKNLLASSCISFILVQTYLSQFLDCPTSKYHNAALRIKIQLNTSYETTIVIAFILITIITATTATNNDDADDNDSDSDSNSGSY
ncbi:hypothetical protein CR513_13188, partial [Mucuna pruriens]